MSNKKSKNYSVIVRLKKQGDFDTLFATKVSGSLCDRAITVYREGKNGLKVTEIASDCVESIDYLDQDTIVVPDDPK